MKKIYLCIAFFTAMCGVIKAQTFVRVYNASGEKIAKGHLIERFNNDSVLVLANKDSNVTIPIPEVGYIKTKHSIGNNILIGAAIGAPTGAILGGLGASSADQLANVFTGETSTPDVGAGIALGLVSGAATGAAIGAITGAFKNSKTFVINGDIQTWKKVRAHLY